MTFENKLVAIINKEIETGVAMNAMAHMVLGFSQQISKDLLKLDDYQDKEGNIYPNISQMPFIILRAKSNEIRKLIQSAKQQQIKFSAFIHTMTGGSWQEQLSNTLITPEAELVYYGGVLFGPWETISQMTKKFSLYK